MAMGLIITAISVIFTLGILGLVGFLLWKFVFKPMRETRQLLQTGLPGKAKILGLAETGVTINNQPQVKIMLEVTPDGRLGRSYQAEVKTLISMVHIPQYQPGARLLIKYDPNDPNRVAIAGFDTSPA